MLTALLNDCIYELKTIRAMENISNDRKKQEKIDNSFKAVVAQSDNIMNSIFLAYSRVGFIPSIEVKNIIIDILTEIEKVIKLGLARENTNTLITNKCKKMNNKIKDEWVEFYSDKSDGLLSLLDTVKDITSDKVKTQQSINKIKKGIPWPLEEKNLWFFQSGLSESEKIIADLDLDEEIILFLKKVGNGNATIADITRNILQWIERAQLETKLAVNFMEYE